MLDRPRRALPKTLYTASKRFWRSYDGEGVAHRREGLTCIQIGQFDRQESESPMSHPAVGDVFVIDRAR